MASMQPAVSKTWMNLRLGSRVSDGGPADVRRALTRIRTPEQALVQAVLANAACGLPAQARGNKQ
jgi:hypothetical protein